MTDDVYRERARLVAHLAALYPSHIGFTDPAEPGWAVVVIEGPAGQMSWHVAPGDLELFGHVRRTQPGDPPWDGHSTATKYERLAALHDDVSRETSTAQEMAAGSRAYAAYGAAVGWKTHDGRQMPPWFDLGPQVQRGWIAVGRQALDDVSRETSRLDVAPDLVAVLIDEYADGISPERLAELVDAMRERYGYGA